MYDFIFNALNLTMIRKITINVIDFRGRSRLAFDVTFKNQKLKTG